MQKTILILFISLVSLSFQQINPLYPDLDLPFCNNFTSLLPHALTIDGFCPQVFFTGLSAPRQIAIASNNDVLVVEQGSQQIRLLYTDGNFYDEVKSVILAKQSGLDHSLVIDEDNHYLYASSSKDVYRWNYYAGNRTNLGTGTLIIKNIPCCHHTTRALAIDPSNPEMLYVQVGSSSNIDNNTLHARINRFNLTELLPNNPNGIDWNDGLVVVNGTRNEISIHFDSKNRLFGCEAGPDNEYRADLGGDIHLTNPSEEFNLFDIENPGKFYGYPYCFSSYNLLSYPAGTQFAQKEFMPSITDEWCQDPANVVVPKLNMQPHTTPIDFAFTDNMDYPSDYLDSAFISLHGSWNANPPQGYRVDFIEFQNSLPVSTIPFVAYEGPGAYSSSKWQRPTGVAKYKSTTNSIKDDSILVASDTTGIIFIITYAPK